MSRGLAYDGEDIGTSAEEERGRTRLRAVDIQTLAPQQQQQQAPATRASVHTLTASPASSFVHLSLATGNDPALGADDTIHRSRSRSAAPSLPIPIPGAVGSRRVAFHSAERAAAEDDSGNDSGGRSPAGRIP
ncbi:uncharacterized protein ColSpa_00483 [Colletotrichum spaethianum]|uniref:Uncharacterized protein n=1 Tax=Colletotrichum spaethianum TaxID=700344 RepID=A0AA37L9K7_9PEZI|nr:uncharacterized protein ColSpa_00483 [Colletotrichum spaethianum]GKT40302.1 hypothetical protein ColSpa_00483 [Colletotrichum spaethianum]